MNTDDLNFAYKVRHALNEHLDDLPASTTDRLAQARKLALARKKAHVEAPLKVRVSKNALAGAGTGFFSFSWMTRMSVALPLLVLVGGLAAWQSQGLAMVTPEAPRARGTIHEQPSLAPTVSVEDVVANLATQARTVVDARAADRYRGENETIDPVGGHIPGAKNRFFKDNLNADGRFKDAAQLKEEFAPLFASAPQAIMQCGSGVTACHNLLALEVAGLSGAALYPGSWSEWCADPARPVATGD